MSGLTALTHVPRLFATKSTAKKKTSKSSGHATETLFFFENRGPKVIEARDEKGVSSSSIPPRSAEELIDVDDAAGSR